VRNLFRISRLNYERMLALTAEQDRLYAVLKNGTIVEDTIEIICDGTDAELLIMTMKAVCPDEAAINPVEWR
jgi:hypothetical protein